MSNKWASIPELIRNWFRYGLENQLLSFPNKMGKKFLLLSPSPGNIYPPLTHHWESRFVIEGFLPKSRKKGENGMPFVRKVIYLRLGLR